MPVTTATPAAPSGAPSAIGNLLAGIRRRIYLVRLTERLVIALSWGGAVAVCLTGARLLREGTIAFDISRPGFGWCALLLALLPLGMGYWAFNKYRDICRLTVNGVTTLTPNLILAALGMTVLLSVAGVVMIFLKAGGQIPVWVVPVAAMVPFVALAAGSVRMIDERAAAIFVDQQVGLHERVSTALEMMNAPAESAFEKAFQVPVMASAVDACQQVRTALQSRANRVGFYRLDQRAYAVAALAAIAAAGVTLLTPLPAQAKIKPRATTIAVSQAKKLEQVMQELQEKTPAGDKTTEQHLKPLEQAIQQLQQGNMSDLQKTAALSEAKEQMRKDQEAMKAADNVQKMLRESQQTREFAKAAEESAQGKVAEAQGQSGAAPQAGSQDLKNAAEGVAKSAGGMSEKDRKELGEKLEAAANAAGADPQLKEDLHKAADAAKSGDADKLASSMKSAGERMSNQRAEGQMSKDSMNRAMSEIDNLQGQSGGQSTMMNNPGGGQQGGGDKQGGGGEQQQAGGGDGQQPQGGGGGEKQGGGDGQQAQAGGGSQQGAGSQGQGGDGSGPGQNGGSTMMNAPGGAGGNENGPRGGVRTFVRMYDETHTDTNGTTEKVGSKINPLGGAAKGTIDVMGPADKNDPAFKPLQEILEDTRQRQMDELDRQEYPAQYKDMIKAFYDDPGKK